jgi:hypothetical protein
MAPISRRLNLTEKLKNGGHALGLSYVKQVICTEKAVLIVSPEAKSLFCGFLGDIGCGSFQRVLLVSQPVGHALRSV